MTKNKLTDKELDEALDRMFKAVKKAPVVLPVRNLYVRCEQEPSKRKRSPAEQGLARAR